MTDRLVHGKGRACPGLFCALHSGLTISTKQDSAYRFNQINRMDQIDSCRQSGCIDNPPSRHHASQKEFRMSTNDPKHPTGATTGTGTPAPSDRNSLTIGPNGPILLHDVHFLEQMAHFNREKVPERQPHAKGAGAFGVFEATGDVSKYTKA